MYITKDVLKLNIEFLAQVIYYYKRYSLESLETAHEELKKRLAQMEIDEP